MLRFNRTTVLLAVALLFCLLVSALLYWKLNYLQSGVITFKDAIPRVDVHFDSSDQIFKHYIEDLGIFKQDGVNYFETPDDQPRSITISAIHVELVEDKQNFIISTDPYSTINASYSIKLEGNNLLIKYQVRYEGVTNDQILKNYKRRLANNLLYILTKISSKQSKIGINPAQIQTTIDDGIDWNQTKFIQLGELQ